jgi:hypothetical protein
MRFTTEEKLDELRTELRYRRRVYARLVVQGKMSEADADHRLAIMTEIAMDYQDKVTLANPMLPGLK